MHIPKSCLARPRWSVDLGHLAAAEASLTRAASVGLQQGVELFKPGRYGARTTDSEGAKCLGRGDGGQSVYGSG